MKRIQLYQKKREFLFKLTDDLPNDKKNALITKTDLFNSHDGMHQKWNLIKDFSNESLLDEVIRCIQLAKQFQIS